jgi:hypothetical protein
VGKTVLVVLGFPRDRVRRRPGSVALGVWREYGQRMGRRRKAGHPGAPSHDPHPLAPSPASQERGNVSVINGVMGGGAGAAPAGVAVRCGATGRGTW